MCRALALGLCSFLATAADLTIHGQVLDENNTPVPGARIYLTPIAGESGQSVQVQSDPTGRFELPASTASAYDIRIDREGHFVVRQQITLAEASAELRVTLPRQIASAQTLDVLYSPAAIDLDRTHTQTLITGSELLDVPYPKTNELRNALRILPGIVQDSRGGLHINGGAEEQVLYTLDGFTMNDPLSGRLETRLSVEAVRAFELKSGSLPAEYGKGAAGALSIRTEPGTDQHHYSATNFIPGFERQKHWMIGGWTPRFGFSGPLRRGRAWLSNSTDIQYTNTVIQDAAPGKDQSSSWRGGNLLRLQVNLTAANILTAGLLVNYWNARKTGLSALDPIETTADRRARSYFFNVKDQIAYRGGGLAEFGYAAFRSFGREIPQGGQPQIFTPYGRRGNYLLDARRWASRDEVLFNVFLPGWSRAGRHQFKVGFDADLIAYEQDVHRNGYEFRRADNTLLRQTRFAGSGAFRNTNREISAYLQDSWKLSRSLLLELGLRHDWDALVRRSTLAPRVGIAQALGARTKLAGGYAAVYEPGNLRVFSEALDQRSIATAYVFGGTAEPLVSVTRYEVDQRVLSSPRYSTWNASVEHEFTRQIYARAGYLRRRGSRGFAFLPLATIDSSVQYSAAPGAAVITQRLTNLRTDLYDSFEVLMRHSFRRRHEWMASYTRSRALSNAVTDVRMDNPILSANNTGPMPWDSPNRLLSWGYLPTWSEAWAVAYMLEYRTGQPFSINDESGMVLGKTNDHRYPTFLELNTHVERRLTLLGYRWALRFGFNNVTNHKNPNVVVNTIGTADFLRFYGGQRRAFNFRMRWLGKAK